MVSPMLIVWTKGDQLTNAYIRLNVSAIMGHYMHINTKVVSEKNLSENHFNAEQNVLGNLVSGRKGKCDESKIPT